MHYSLVTKANQPRGIAGDLTFVQQIPTESPSLRSFSVQSVMFSSHCHICLSLVFPRHSGENEKKNKKQKKQKTLN